MQTNAIHLFVSCIQLYDGKKCHHDFFIGNNDDLVKYQY